MANKVDFGPMDEKETFDTVVEGLGFLSLDQVYDALKSGLSEDDLEELALRLNEVDEPDQ